MSDEFEFQLTAAKVSSKSELDKDNELEYYLLNSIKGQLPSVRRQELAQMDKENMQNRVTMLPKAQFRKPCMQKANSLVKPRLPFQQLESRELTYSQTPGSEKLLSMRSLREGSSNMKAFVGHFEDSSPFVGQFSLQRSSHNKQSKETCKIASQEQFLNYPNTNSPNSQTDIDGLGAEILTELQNLKSQVKSTKARTAVHLDKRGMKTTKRSDCDRLLAKSIAEQSNSRHNIEKSIGEIRRSAGNMIGALKANCKPSDDHLGLHVNEEYAMPNRSDCLSVPGLQSSQLTRDSNLTSLKSTRDTFRHLLKHISISQAKPLV